MSSEKPQLTGFSEARRETNLCVAGILEKPPILAMRKRHPTRRWLKRHWKDLAKAIGAVLGGLGLLLQGIGALLH
jgi:hypothetical protein